MTSEDEVPRPVSLLAEAELLLQQRECGHALTVFDRAEAAGAEKDRCDAGRWMAHMLLGEYEQAWQASDAIRARGGADAHRFWQGESLRGKRVMLRCLHGYGDTVQYLRWLPAMRAEAAEVTVQAAPEMLPLLRCLAGMGPVVTWAAPGEAEPAWDVQVECAELPYLFRATPATLPPPAKMVFAESDAHRVRMRLGQRTKPRVGLVWHGSDFDRARSIPFEQLRESMLRERGVEFWSLQPPGSNALWELYCREHGLGERTFYTRDADGALRNAGIADMAVFAQELDLVITIDTLLAHVAGSLGVPTWLLLKREADWRWMLDRADTPWYPGTVLVRQEAAGEWDGVLRGVCADLRDWLEEGEQYDRQG